MSIFFERQRSFSIKPTRFLLFSLTISSFFVFLSLFSVWAPNASTLFSLEDTKFLFRTSSSLGLGPKPPLATQHSSGFSKNYSSNNVLSPNFTDAQLSRLDNGANASTVFSIQGLHRFVSDSTTLPHGKISNRTSVNDSVAGRLSLNSSTSGVKTSILHHGMRPEIAVGVAKNSVLDKNNESILVKVYDSGNYSIRQHNEIDFPTKEVNLSMGRKVEGKDKSMCDVTKGRWVRDESYPLYTSATCPFIDEGFNCQANGRIDKDYMKWRWQPQDCDIPSLTVWRQGD